MRGLNDYRRSGRRNGCPVNGAGVCVHPLHVDAGRLAALLQATNPVQARRDVGQLCATLLERVRRKAVTCTFCLIRWRRSWLMRRQPSARSLYSSVLTTAGSLSDWS